MIKRILFLVTILFNCGLLISQNNLIRQPSISPDASQMAFSYHGDIWVYNFANKQSKRITIHQAYESNPVWNAKGTQVAFASNRRGSTNIFISSVRGGVPKQMTYFPTTDTPSQWTSDGKILFNSNRMYKGPEWDPAMYAVNQNGETPQRLLTALGSQPAISPNGKYIAFVKGACRISREDYSGSAQRDVWIYNVKTKKYYQITTSPKNDHTPLWDANNNLYYVSAQSGRYNIYKTSLLTNGAANGKAKRLTRLNKNGVWSYSVSKNGTIVYNSGIDVYKFQNGLSKKIKLQLATDNRFELEETKTVSNGISNLSVSPNGKLFALSINGEIFVKENNKTKANANNVSNHSFRDDNPFWIDNNTLGFLSDRSGQNELYKVVSTDKNVQLNRSLKTKITKLTTSKIDVFEPLLSPDRKKISYRIGRGKFVIGTFVKGEIKNIKTYSDTWAAAQGVAWSPDSKYVAYSQEDLNFDSEIYIQSVANPTIKMNVSMHPRSDVGPVWSQDG